MTLVLILIAIISIIIFLTFSIILSNQLINSLKNFQKGLLSFFGYVNKENKNVEMLDDKYEDEFGNMAKIVNENILKTKKTIDSDNKFLEQINEVVEVVKNGYLNKRLEEKVESQSMEKLRIHINEMLYSLQLRICTNVNDISYALEKYSKLDFTHRIKGCNSGVTVGLNNLADIINSMLVEKQTIIYGRQTGFLAGRVPNGVMLGRIGIHRLVQPAMNRQICLLITTQSQWHHQHRPRHRSLVNAGHHRSAVNLHATGAGNLHTQHFRHGTLTQKCTVSHSLGYPCQKGIGGQLGHLVIVGVCSCWRDCFAVCICFR
jgi:hypothetical protein